MRFFIIICFIGLRFQGFTQEKCYIPINSILSPPLTIHYLNGKIMTVTTFPEISKGFQIYGNSVGSRIVKQYDQCGNLRNTTTYFVHKPTFSCWSENKTWYTQTDIVVKNVDCEYEWFNPTESLSNYLGVKKNDYESKFRLNLKFSKISFHFQWSKLYQKGFKTKKETFRFPF